MKVLYQGPSFHGDWRKFSAVKIEKYTEKAFLFMISVAPIRRIWVPKSIARVEEYDEGLIVKVPIWFKGGM